MIRTGLVLSIAALVAGCAAKEISSVDSLAEGSDNAPYNVLMMLKTHRIETAGIVEVVYSGKDSDEDVYHGWLDLNGNDFRDSEESWVLPSHEITGQFVQGQHTLDVSYLEPGTYEVIFALIDSQGQLGFSRPKELVINEPVEEILGSGGELHTIGPLAPQYARQPESEVYQRNDVQALMQYVIDSASDELSPSYLPTTIDVTLLDGGNVTVGVYTDDGHPYMMDFLIKSDDPLRAPNYDCGHNEDCFLPLVEEVNAALGVQE